MLLGERIIIQFILTRTAFEQQFDGPTQNNYPFYYTNLRKFNNQVAKVLFIIFNHIICMWVRKPYKTIYKWLDKAWMRFFFKKIARINY